MWSPCSCMLEIWRSKIKWALSHQCGHSDELLGLGALLHATCQWAEWAKDSVPCRFFPTSPPHRQRLQNLSQQWKDGRLWEAPTIHIIKP